MSSNNAATLVILTHLLVVMVVSASARFGKDCIVLERTQRRYLKVGVGAVFTIGYFPFLTCAFASSVILLLNFSPASTLLFRTSSGKPNFVFLPASSSGEYFAHNLWIPFLKLLFLERTSGVIVLYVEEIDLVQIGFSCHFAFDLLCYKEGGHDIKK